MIFKSKKPTDKNIREYFLNEINHYREKIFYRETQIEDFKELLRYIKPLVKNSHFEKKDPIFYYWHVDFDDGHTETIAITEHGYRTVRSWLDGEFEEDKCTQSLL